MTAAVVEGTLTEDAIDSKTSVCIYIKIGWSPLTSMLKIEKMSEDAW